jgi:hypothetical protein
MNDDTDQLLALQNRRLSPAEAQAYLDAPASDTEREQLQELVAWFQRRYPSPLERLAYVRRAYARWQRTRGLASDGPGPSTEEVEGREQP